MGSNYPVCRGFSYGDACEPDRYCCGTVLGVATVEECRAALARLTENLARNADEVRDKVNLDRTIVCRVTDLQVAFRGRLVGGELRDVAEGDDPDAKIKLSAKSDDLIAMVDGELDFAKALATRRASVSANPFDLIKLRKLL
jgi:SCP-2 sterol transfer family